MSLGSQGNGWGVEIKVSGGELTEAERKAIVQLSGAFQEAIDGLGASPPKLALGGVTGSDTALVSSIDFTARAKADGKDDIQAVAFHADAKSRSLNPSGTVKVDVDMSQPALLRNSEQQARAVTRYLQQTDATGSGTGATPRRGRCSRRPSRNSTAKMPGWCCIFVLSS